MRHHKDGEEKSPSSSRADEEVELTAKQPTPSTEADARKRFRRKITLFGKEVSRELFVGSILTLSLAAIGIGVVVTVSNSGSGEEPPKLPRPPLAVQERDARTPKAKGPVEEKVWVSGGVRAFADPYTQSGVGKRIPAGQTVSVACKLYWPHPPSVAEEGFWYRIRTSPWNGRFAPANVFWNGDKKGKTPSHATDFHVRSCRGQQLPAEDPGA